MFSVLRKYEDRLAKAELNQIESLRIMKKLELEADKVKGLVTQVVSCLDTLIREIDHDKMDLSEEKKEFDISDLEL